MEEEEGGGNFPRELCCGGAQTRAACASISGSAGTCVQGTSACAACVHPCHCVSRVINTAGGAVTRAKKMRKFPQAESGMGQGTCQGCTSLG